MANVQTPRFQELLKRLLGLRQSAPFDASDSLVPTIPVLDPARPELLYLRDERTWYGKNSSGAPAAGALGFVRLENPAVAGSTLLVIVEGAYIQNPDGASASAYNIYPNTSVGVGAVAGSDQRPREMRRYTGAQTQSGVDIRQGTRLVGTFIDAGIIVAHAAGAAGFVFVPLDIVLPPGTAVELENRNTVGGAAAGALATFLYRVRSADQAEVF